MTRLQWFQVSKFKLPELKRLTERMLAEKYDDNRGWGYQVADTRKNFLTGKYIEKIKRTEAITDPFGKIQSFEIVAYQEIIFCFQVEWPQLQVKNSPRNMGPFFTTIGECLNFEVGISEIVISPTEWFRLVEKISKNAIVIKANINDMALSNLTSASLTITGSEDVRKHFQKITLGKPHNINFLQIECKYGEEFVRFEVNSTSRIKLISDNDERCVPFFRDCLTKLKQRLKVHDE